MAQPLVSILIPAHNAEPWLEQAIRSALAQTWPRTEIIIVDDGSTDRTHAVGQRFASARVQVRTQANQGASAARNHALQLAQGDFIQWLEADDLLAPEKIAAQLASAGDGKTLLSSAWGKFYFRPQRAVFRPDGLWENLSPIEWLTRKFESNAWMAINAWLVPRALVTAAGAWDVSVSMDDDGEYFSRVIAAANSVVFVPSAKALVRRANPGSLSGDFASAAKLESQLRATRLQITRLRQLTDSPRVRAAALAALQRWQIYFYPEHPELVAESRRLAAELGGELAEPQLNWKYAPLQKFFGWPFAKRASRALPRARAWGVRTWDFCLARFDRPAGI
jgi:glycosyltransferase involved in cell wall biosynthesis